MANVSLLNKTTFKVNDDLTIKIPTMGELRSQVEGGNEIVYPYYLMLVNMFLATSCDLMVELDEQGIDFTKWSDYNTFLTLFSSMDKDTLRTYSYLLLQDHNLADFVMVPDADGQHIVLFNPEGIILDEMLYLQMSSVFSAITGIKKNKRKMGNETMKQYAIERTKAHRRNAAKRIKSSIEMTFDKEIIALVNNANFKYDYATVNNLTIYDFNVSQKQIIKKYHVDNTYRGIYAGTIKIESKDNNKLNWLDYES